MEQCEDINEFKKKYLNLEGLEFEIKDHKKTKLYFTAFRAYLQHRNILLHQVLSALLLLTIVYNSYVYQVRM